MRHFAHGPDTIRLGDLEVRRFGFGAMRLPGKGVWGEPEEPATAHAVLRRAIELGVNLIDTAWYYGPYVANRLIVEALHPYPSDLVIATKVGARRPDDRTWVPALRPAELRAGVEDDLRTLRLEQLPIVHLRWMDQPDASFDEALDVLLELQHEGLLRHVALSNVNITQLEAALAKTPIACVQNVFNLGPVGSGAEHAQDVLAACERHGIAFLPYFPLALGSLTAGGGALDAAARRHGCSSAQLALAWLLARSPVILPIPGTSKVAHLEENMGATHVALDPDVVAELAPNR
ncbi:MAG: aldo/keto reductase [Myxococcota bacterium]|nr:aldo/keto reductase [Myxococcota bacterium]